MEFWIWLVALGVGMLILILVILRFASRGFKLAKKLKPFAEHIARFQKHAQQYPEALKFYSDLAKAQETPAKKPRNSQG